MSNELQNRRVAILATDGFEYLELTKPKQALEGAGAKTEVIYPKKGAINGLGRGQVGRQRSCRCQPERCKP